MPRASIDPKDIHVSLKDILRPRLELLCRKMDIELPSVKVQQMRTAQELRVAYSSGSLHIPERALSDLSHDELDFGIVSAMVPTPLERWLPMILGAAPFLLALGIAYGLVTEYRGYWQENFTLAWMTLAGVLSAGYLLGVAASLITRRLLLRKTFMGALMITGNVRAAESYLLSELSPDGPRRLRRAHQKALDGRLKLLWEAADRLGMK